MTRYIYTKQRGFNEVIEATMEKPGNITQDYDEDCVCKECNHETLRWHAYNNHLSTAPRYPIEGDIPENWKEGDEVQVVLQHQCRAISFQLRWNNFCPLKEPFIEPSDDFETRIVAILIPRKILDCGNESCEATYDLCYTEGCQNPIYENNSTPVVGLKIGNPLHEEFNTVEGKEENKYLVNDKYYCKHFPTVPCQLNNLECIAPECLINVEPESEEEKCSECKGYGWVVGVGVEAICCGNPLPNGSCCGNAVPGEIQIQEICPKCHGDGKKETEDELWRENTRLDGRRYTQDNLTTFWHDNTRSTDRPTYYVT